MSTFTSVRQFTDPKSLLFELEDVEFGVTVISFHEFTIPKSQLQPFVNSQSQQEPSSRTLAASGSYFPTLWRFELQLNQNTDSRSTRVERRQEKEDEITTI
ncbi:hypothetical protein L1887_21456 [Cichorium endivia]|nr:hypothetical protein L1887_21456 [Cichorium endivia]